MRFKRVWIRFFFLPVTRTANYSCLQGKLFGARRGGSDA
jgi:hypothetical protein